MSEFVRLFLANPFNINYIIALKSGLFGLLLTLRVIIEKGTCVYIFVQIYYVFLKFSVLNNAKRIFQTVIIHVSAIKVAYIKSILLLYY